MATAHTPESDRRPFWEVQAVFDPDGGGAEFAYTIGLHTRGLPELHIWGRPSLGDDVGADWMLSTSDRCHVLNELGGLLVEGRLPVGTELTREYDGGLTRVRYHVEPAGDREELQAFGVPDGVDVLPVRWSLHRAEEGPPTSIGREAAEAASSLFAEITSRLPGRGRAPRGWALPNNPSFEPDQRFGPLTPIVLARAAQLWQADDETLAALVRAAGNVQSEYPLRHVLSVAAAVARPCGRSEALAELRERVDDLVERLTVAPAAQRRWRSVVRAVDPAWWTQLDPAGRRQAERGFATILHVATVACLAAEAVADVAPPSLLLEGRGAWVRGLSGGELPVAREWEASEEVVAAVGALLEPLDHRGLGVLARWHLLAMTGLVGGLQGYPEVCVRLSSWATVSAAVYPRRLLGELPGWDVLRAGMPGAGPVIVPRELHEWATCVASAITHRGRLSGEEVRLLVGPTGDLLPGLEQVVNSPV